MAFGSTRIIGQFLASRKLHFESLERRDLLAVMRIVDWNTLNGPNNATDVANFTTVLNAIGNETVQGNTQRIDILALQETDPAVSGNDSIGQVASILNSLYPSGNYQYFVTPSDGGGDSTGFVYDTTTVSLLESTQVLAGSLTHSVARGKFQPYGTSGEADFYVYSIHLKSGTAGSDASTRASEASLLRANADALNEGANVLFVGDFNMQGSSELAYSTFLSAGAGQLIDVGDAPGNWNDNPAFKHLHTQDPMSTMDDRFDIQFATGEFFDGIGLDYVSGSYRVFGNNGTHGLNQPITTGTGASPAVLAALAAASDHLPVVADYQVIPSTPRVRITQTLGGTKVAEGGFYDTYHVVLDTVPAANVTVTITPSSQLDLGNGAGVATVLTFTPANALTPQTVVVHAVDDLVGEGDHTSAIVHVAASSDAAYNLLAIPNLVVSIVDNDAPNWVVNELDSDTSGTDSAEFIEIYDGGAGNVSLTGKVLVFYNGANDLSYAAFDLDGLSTDVNGFFVLGNAAVPGVDLVFANNLLQNGADAVALYTGNATDFPNGTAITLTNLLDAIVYDTADADDAGLLVLLDHSGGAQPQVNEDFGSTGDTKSIARVPDGGAQRKTQSYVAQAPTPGTFNTPQHYGIEFVQSGTRVDVVEGGAIDSYQIALESIPTANVQITVDPDNQTDLGAGAGVAIVLIFTPANALIPQLITVTAVDDAVIEGSHTSVITHSVSSVDANYNGLSVSNLVANITDNDLPPPTSIVISEIMYNPASNEGGAASPEWIEIVNTGAGAVDLGGWRFDDEDAANWGAIQAGTILNPNQIGVFFDSAFTTVAQFRIDWAVPAGALVVGVSWGSLGNSPAPGNEVLQLIDNLNTVQDTVNYDDTNPWPAAADGPSIYLKNLAADNSVGSNWGRSAAVNKAVSPTSVTYSAADIGSPGRVFLAGDYNLNGVVDAADYVLWRKTLGQTGAGLAADGSGPTVGTPNGVVDQADYAFWRSNFGAVGVPNGGLGSGSGGGEGVGSQMMTAAGAMDSSSMSVAATAADSGFDVTSANGRPAELFDLASTEWGGPIAARSATTVAQQQDSSAATSLLLSLVAYHDAPQADDGIYCSVASGDSQPHDEIDELFGSLGEAEDPFYSRWASVL